MHTTFLHNILTRVTTSFHHNFGVPPTPSPNTFTVSPLAFCSVDQLSGFCCVQPFVTPLLYFFLSSFQRDHYIFVPFQLTSFHVVLSKSIHIAEIGCFLLFLESSSISLWIHATVSLVT